MANADNIWKYLATCVHEVNQQLPAGTQLGCETSTILLGEGAVLDSLGLISFVVSLEQQLQANANITLALLDALMEGKDDTAFTTLGQLHAYVVRQA